MRPINKGACPKDVNGADKVVSEYDEWRLDLINAIGAYCVYCNAPLSHSLQVEHVVPKKPQLGAQQGGLLDWDNVLLSCGPCNRAKWNYPSNSILHYLPEEHNTLIPFTTTCILASNGDNAMLVTPKKNLSPQQSKKALHTIGLLKLDRVDIRENIVDLRWKLRWEECLRVQAARNLLEMIKKYPDYLQKADMVGRDIARTAHGFFLLWFEEFKDEPYVIKWLIDSSIFKGVDRKCFDANYKLAYRNLGLPDPI